MEANNRFGLQVQGLSLARDKVLIVADLERRRSDTGRFTASDIRKAFEALHVPPVGSVSRELKRLAQDGLTVHLTDSWAVTPMGIDRAQKVVQSSPEAPSGAIASAQFAHTDHTVIPTYAAPPRWSTGISRLLERHPFDTNVLCMTRFPSEGATPDPVAHAVDCAREELKKFDLHLHLASDQIVDDDLLGNVGAYMWACRYGLGIIEDRLGIGLNYNAILEIGGMAITGRRCGILKDSTVSRGLPTDLSGHIYKSVDLDDEDCVRRAVTQWAGDDLGLAPNHPNA